MGLLAWMKSKVPSSSSGQWCLHYSSKAIMIHSKSNLVILRWRKALGATHLQDCGLIEFVLREAAATSTLDFIRYENTVKEERRGHLSCTNKLSFSKSSRDGIWRAQHFPLSSLKWPERTTKPRAKPRRRAWGASSSKGPRGLLYAQEIQRIGNKLKPWFK